MDILVLVPVAALVLVSSVRFSGHRIPAWPCVLVAGGVLALFLCLRAMVPDEQVFIGSEASRRVRAQVRDLQNKPNWWGKDILIVEGSSIATYGIDNREVEVALAARGWDPIVLEFALPAANHFAEKQTGHFPGPSRKSSNVRISMTAPGRKPRPWAG